MHLVVVLLRVNIYFTLSPLKPQYIAEPPQVELDVRVCVWVIALNSGHHHSLRILYKSKYVIHWKPWRSMRSI